MIKNKITSPAQFSSRNLMFLVLGIATCFISKFQAQEMEPRSLTNLPTSTHFALANYGYGQGNILLDQALPVEDLKAKINIATIAYIKAFGIFQKSGKVGIILPYASANWKGKVEGLDSVRSQNGLADMRFLISYNLWGSPALKKENFSAYDPENILGVSFVAILPTGKYDKDRLINLGSNRFTLKSQLGYAHYFNRFILESYVALWLFGKNQSFYGGNVLEQSPLLAVKVHGVFAISQKFWCAADLGYGVGARAYVNGKKRHNRISTLRFGVTTAYAINPQHALKLNWLSGLRFERGGDFDNVSFTYQYMWN